MPDLYFLGGVWKTTLLPPTISMLLSSSDSRKSAAHFHYLTLKMIKVSFIKANKRVLNFLNYWKVFSNYFPDLANSYQLMTFWSVKTLRVRKSKNFPDSKIFHAKNFRIKRVNRDTFAFATKVRKTGECHVFLPNLHNVGLDGVWIIRWLSGLSGKFIDCLESFWIVRTFLRLSEILWIVRTIPRLSGQSLGS